jgi:hypothetical protein
MRRTIVDDPEHAARVVARRPRHHPLDQAVNGSDPVFGLATTKDSAVMHSQGGYVGPGIATKVLMFDAHGDAWSASSCEVFATPHLDADSCAAGCIF